MTAQTFTMPTYNRLDIEFSRGDGVYLWDQHGRKYLDALSGIAVCALGHAHPGVAAVIRDQAETLIHTSNLYGIPLQEQLAAKLAQLTGLERVFFCNSGAEANETAIKIARKYGHDRGLRAPQIIVADNSFHGRTLATLSATGNEKVQDGFGPLVEGFIRVPYDDVAAVDAVLTQRDDVVAVFIEPVQGEGGINIPSSGFLSSLRALCSRHSVLLMLDEVQTGMCRSGCWFAFQHSDIAPDVVTLAKALGNGFPIGCCLASGECSTVLGPGSHGTTFGGNPLASRVALSVIEIMEKSSLDARSARLGDMMREQFRQRLRNIPGVVAVRGLGLLLAIELDRPCAVLVDRVMQAGVLINVTAQTVVRLLPPLIITDVQAVDVVNIVSNSVVDFLRVDE